MRISVESKNYPELNGLSAKVIAVIIAEAVEDFLKTDKGKAACAAFTKNENKKLNAGKDNE